MLNAIHATPAGRRACWFALRGRTAALSARGDATRARHPEPSTSTQIFDPFFTTKEPDQGSGLGLMICHRIVADHGGSIEVRSNEGEGACFSVLWPIDARAAAASA